MGFPLYFYFFGGGGGGGGGGFLTFKGLLSPFRPFPLLLGAKLAILTIILPLLLLTVLHV